MALTMSMVMFLRVLILISILVFVFGVNFPRVVVSINHVSQSVSQLNSSVHWSLSGRTGSVGFVCKPKPVNNTANATQHRNTSTRTHLNQPLTEVKCKINGNSHKAEPCGAEVFVYSFQICSRVRFLKTVLPQNQKRQTQIWD